MASWDGGILDSIRDIGNDVSGFFDSSIVKGLSTAYTFGSQKQEVQKRQLNYMPVDGVRDLTRETDFIESEDFSRVEAEWMERLRRFSGLNAAVKDTEVRLG